MMEPVDLISNALDIFQEYVTPSAINVIKFDTHLVRGMEEFIYGEFFLKNLRSTIPLCKA